MEQNSQTDITKSSFSKLSTDCFIVLSFIFIEIKLLKITQLTKYLLHHP